MPDGKDMDDLIADGEQDPVDAPALAVQQMTDFLAERVRLGRQGAAAGVLGQGFEGGEEAAVSSGRAG
jgi:hypothetical protein